MIALVRIALSRPYTFVVLALLLLIIGPLAALRTPTDIFPDIRIPVIGVVWNYTGLPPDQMSGRIITPFQRALTTTVNDIEHIVANSYTGIGIVKIFFQPNVDIRTANAQVTAISQTMIRQLPPGATPPLILNYSASTVPIIQVALSGEGLTEQNLADIGINQLRTPLVTVPGAAIPYPFGGKQRQVQIDLNPAALQARGLSGQDVANALAAQNLITPVGTQKIGQFEYTIQLNNSPLRMEELGGSADQGRQRRDGLCPRRRFRARRQPAADQHRSRRRQPLGPDDGAEGGRDLDARYHRRHQAEGDRRQGPASGGAEDRLHRRPVGVRPRRDRGRRRRRRDRSAPDQRDDPAVPRQLAFDRHHRRLDPAVGARRHHHAVGDRRDAQHHDARRAGAGGRHPRRRRHRDHRKHQLPSGAGQAGRAVDPRRRQPDRDAGVRIAAVHLHRVRADVLPAGRRALPVRADGRSRDVCDDLVVHPVAHAGADDGEISAAAACPS